MKYKKILPLALLVMIGVSGCATTGKMHLAKYPSEKKAMRLLNVQDACMLEYMGYPNGEYITSTAGDGECRVLAGFYAGTVKAKKYTFESNGKQYESVKMNGSYSEAKHPEEMLKVLEEADTNKDHIVTLNEIQTLKKKVLDDYFKSESEKDQK